MKTIEERAEKARCVYFGYLPMDIGVTYKDGYIKGATEQKAIDIDKACGWLLNFLPTPSWYGSTEEFVDDFRKAMEE